MQAPERLETARLILRRPRAADAPAIYQRYASDPEVTRWLGWPRHTSIADTEGFLGFCAAEWTRAPAGPYLIEGRDGALLGSTGLGFETPFRAMTGYLLAREAWGHGFATEALRAVSELAPRLGIIRLHAYVTWTTKRRRMSSTSAAMHARPSFGVTPCSRTVACPVRSTS